MQDILAKAPEFISNHWFLIVGWAAILVMLIFSCISAMLNKVKEISNIEATMLINKQDAVVVDIRKLEDFNRGHIVNSLNMDMSDIEQNSFAKIIKYKESPIILVCDRGVMSKKAGAILHKQGFTSLFVLKDGIAGWQSEALPLVKK